MKAPHFVLIGNFPPDQQESMQRFAEMMANGLKERGITVELIVPTPFLARGQKEFHRGIGKWLGYMDKWILFPFALRRFVSSREKELGGAVHYHICDHSNAPYLKYLPRERAGITCHDVLAIRGALGYPDAYCPVSSMGRRLQRRILRYLCGTKRVACVSRLTFFQLCEVTKAGDARPGWKVVSNALNASFKKMDRDKAAHLLKQKGIFIQYPFLLHVGSNLPRKNRRMLLEMVRQKGREWGGHIYFAGQSASAGLMDEAKGSGLSERVHSVPNPDHEVLCALYSLAHAMVFPSFSEGFGWPVIEAQACGVPVIASNTEPMPEVSGGAALHADPHDPVSFALALTKLNAPSVRASLIARGHENVGRFRLDKMVDAYLELHGLKKASLETYAA